MNIFYHVPRGLGLTLCVVIVITLLVLLEKRFAPLMHNGGDVYPSLLNFLVILSKTVIPLVVIWRVYELKPVSLGWIEDNLFQAVWKGAVLALLMMAFIFIYRKYSHFLFGTPYTSTGGLIMVQQVSGAAIGISLSAALLNAFGEEIIFRGMLLPSLSRYLGVTIALIAQSFIFTVYHFFPLQNSLLLFIMGIFFGLGYLWSGSLLTPVLTHLIVNGIPALIFLVRSLRAG